MTNTITIPLVFFVITAFAFWVIIGSKGWWWLKMIFLSIALYATVSLWLSLGDLQGWPTASELPSKFEIKWIDAKEPNIKTGYLGAIYVWAKDITKEEEESWYVQMYKAKDESRLYMLPYSREMHEQVGSIQEQIAKGKKFYGELQDGKLGESKGNGNEGENGKGTGEAKTGQGSGGGFGNPYNEKIFHQLPPSTYAPKEPQ